MKCPYRKIVEKVKTNNTETVIEDFCECLEYKCPWYFVDGTEIKGILLKGERCGMVEYAKQN